MLGPQLSPIWGFLGLGFDEVYPLFGEVFAKIIILVRDIDLTFCFLEWNFGSSDLPLTWNNPNTALQTPSIGHILNMEEFIEIFFSVNGNNKFFERQFQITNILSLLGLFVLSIEIYLEGRIWSHVLLLQIFDRVGEEVVDFELIKRNNALRNTRNIKFESRLLAKKTELQKIINLLTNIADLVNLMQENNKSKPDHLVNNLVILDRAAISGRDIGIGTQLQHWK